MSDEVKVIVVDDETIIRMDLEELLLDNGYNVIGSAGDGFEAIRLCKENRPDMILLDVTMPLLDGISAARYIIEEDLADAVILVTAYCDDAFIEEAKEIGVAAYLVKPINERILIPTLKIALSRSKEIKGLRKEVQKVREQMEARKIVEKAKGYVMDKMEMSEKEAYDYIRTVSREKHISMLEVAEIILKGRKKHE